MARAVVIVAPILRATFPMVPTIQVTHSMWVVVPTILELAKLLHYVPHTLPADEYLTRCAQLRTGCASRCQQLCGSNLLPSYAPHTSPLCDYLDQSSIEIVPDVSRPAHIKFIKFLSQLLPNTILL